MSPALLNFQCRDKAEWGRYYLSRRNGVDDLVYEFPPGFRSVAGNPYATTYNTSSLASNAARFACLGVDGPETHGRFSC